jgi:hypothetical protein
VSVLHCEYIVVPEAGGTEPTGARHAFDSRFNPTWDIDRRERLIVLVDGSTAARRAVHLAITLAQESASRLLFVAYLPGEEQDNALDALLLSEALLPAQAEAEVAGVCAERRLLRGPRPLAQMKLLLKTGHGSDRLVLIDPLKLHGPLRALTRTLLLDPPCMLFVLPLDDDPIVALWSRLRGLFGRDGDKTAQP